MPSLPLFQVNEIKAGFTLTAPPFSVLQFSRELEGTLECGCGKSDLRMEDAKWRTKTVCTNMTKLNFYILAALHTQFL